jgi:hypothetical protein
MDTKHIAVSAIWIAVGVAAGWSGDWAVMFWGSFFAFLTSCVLLNYKEDLRK